MTLKTIFGTLHLSEPVFIDLIQSKPMQRLKKIHQYGVTAYSAGSYPYSRYDHSLGVLHLLVNAHVSLAEQIAGLLHDVSHTIFSHVGDILFDQQSVTNSYQDDIHQWFINQTEIPTILNNYGFIVAQVLHKTNNFKALEQDLPSLCADRLEYLLHGSLLEKKISSKNLNQIIDSLHFDGINWYFSDVDTARQLALNALFLTEYLFTSAWNISGYYWAADALKRALENKIISLEQIHFSQDQLVWDTLSSCDNHKIKQLLHKIQHSRKYYQLATSHDYTLHAALKFRGVDPFVHVNEELILLSHLDSTFAQQFYNLKEKLSAGLYLKL